MQLVFPPVGARKILGRPVGDLAVKPHQSYLPGKSYFYDYLTAEELLVYYANLITTDIIRGAPPSACAGQPAAREVGVSAERRLQLRKFKGSNT